MADPVTTAFPLSGNGVRGDVADFLKYRVPMTFASVAEVQGANLDGYTGWIRILSTGAWYKYDASETGPDDGATILECADGNFFVIDSAMYDGDGDSKAYWAADDDWRINIAGSDILQATSTGVVVDLAGSYAEGLTVKGDDDGVGGPLLVLEHESDSPAINDYVGGVTFTGYNDAAQRVYYASIYGRIVDETDGTEDGAQEFFVMKNGTDTRVMRVTGSNLRTYGLNHYVDDDEDTYWQYSTDDTVVLNLGNLSGKATFSSTLTAFKGGVVQNTNESGAAYFRINRNQAHGSSQYIGILDFFGQDSASNNQTFAQIEAYCLDHTSASEDAELRFRAYVAGTLTQTLTVGNGVKVGSPTGGYQGAGTINAVTVYDDGVDVTCYPLAFYLGQKVSYDEWDALVPDRFDETGRVIEKTVHRGLRMFEARLGGPYDPLDLDKYWQHIVDKGHLSSMPNRLRIHEHGKMSSGEWIQRLLETVDIQAIHIHQLNQRVKKMESKHA